MPKVKVISPIERLNPETKVLEQIGRGVVIDISEQDFRFFKKVKAIELVQEQAAQPADVSAVVDAANAVPDLTTAVQQAPLKNRKPSGDGDK